jgi:hypothetical protein
MTNIDGLVVLDVTDIPTITEASFPKEFIPSGYQQLSSNTLWGASKAALQSTVNTGTNDTQYLTPLTHATYHGAGTSKFESSEITIPTATTWYVTASHGLGVMPDLWQASVRYKSGVADGYAADDEVIIASDMYGTGTTIGQTVWANTTVIGLSMSSLIAGGFYVMNKTTGATAVITAGSWKIVLRAVKF